MRNDVMKKLEEKFILRKRQANSHKYDYGSILIVGGNIGMTGAPLISAYSAMRTGSGLSAIAIQEKYIQYLNNIYPEIMVRPYKDEKDFLKLLHKKDAIAFGPGLGRVDEYGGILETLIDKQLPLIIDADGIYYLNRLKNKIKRPNNIVITPHYGEMALFLDTDSKAVSKDPISFIKQVTKQYGIMVVLKGPTTFIADENEIIHSSLGNPGMATAGSGDVLTGIITSLVGQGLSMLEACKLGVYIHSKAGCLASEKNGEYSMMATDIINEIPQILKDISDKD